MKTVVGNLCSPFLLSQLGNSRPCLLKLRTSAASPVFKRSFVAPIKVRAAAYSAVVRVEPTEPVVVQNDGISSKNILACPICYDPFSSSSDPGLSVESVSGSSFQCRTCKKTYFGNETHIDLTTASGAKDYGESKPVSTEMFRTPLVSYLYERGWRQSFTVWGGFPGPETEFELTKDFLKPVLGGGNIIDASCGSGMFSRLFAKSGLFSLVVALDYSENMLKECYGFIQQEENFPKENMILVRADISRLPFATGSVDAVHAGAAIHCWPSPSTAVAEISRVRRPGGVIRTPLVSYLYERGWRQSFTVWGGFPGPEKEFELIKDFLKPVLGGGNIIDASCGSGKFSRLFAKSGLFSLVVALDYSENMLKECYGFIQQEENLPKENMILVRADISRLPFASNSVDAVHAGAAIHCWPSPSSTVAEISRVLRPGGVFVATTFIWDGPFSLIPFQRNIAQRTKQISGNQLFISESELEDICQACGLVGFTKVRNGRFVMISATKPI